MSHLGLDTRISVATGSRAHLQDFLCLGNPADTLSRAGLASPEVGPPQGFESIEVLNLWEEATLEPDVR